MCQPVHVDHFKETAAQQKDVKERRQAGKRAAALNEKRQPDDPAHKVHDDVKGCGGAGGFGKHVPGNMHKN